MSSTHSQEDWLDSEDLRPLRPEQRTWGFWTYSIFWLSAAANLSNWYSPNSFMTVGLSLWEALGCHTAGQLLAGISMAFSGRPGAAHGIGYPVLCRSSWGMLGAFWPILNRIVTSIIWNSINLVQGGQCVYVMLRCIFPSIAHLHNVMAPTDSINSGGLIGFFIFWLITTAICFIPIPKLKATIHIKVVVFLVSGIVMLAWTVTLARQHGKFTIPPGHFHGSGRSWMICKFIFLSWGNCSTFIANASDFQRYARKPSDVLFGQLVGFPLGNFIIGLVGLIVATTSTTIFGEIIWNPVTYLDTLLASNYHASYRAGVFFLALMFAYSSLFSCILENLLPAGNDFAGIWPRHITVKRGVLIANVLSLACVPWKLLGTATHFISWLSAYQSFLACIVGILVADYYIVNRRKLDTIRDLYVSNQTSTYWYTFGFNWRAYVAYIIGVACNFYGFLSVFGVDNTLAGKRYYFFAFPTSLIYSFMIYLLLTWLFPTPAWKNRTSRCFSVWDGYVTDEKTSGSLKHDNDSSINCEK